MEAASVSDGSDAAVLALHVAVPGDGILIRRHSDLLFVGSPRAADPRPGSDPWADGSFEQLTSAFRDARWGEAADAVTAVAADADFAVSDFLVADWGARLHLTVFGDLVVESDLRSMPRLSAAGSGTWVERTVRIDGPTAITVSVSGIDHPGHNRLR